MLYAYNTIEKYDGITPFEMIYGVEPYNLESAGIKEHWPLYDKEFDRRVYQANIREERALKELEEVDGNWQLPIINHFKLNEVVMRKNITGRTKGEEAYSGTFRIYKVRSKVSYDIKDILYPYKEIERVHYTNLKPLNLNLEEVLRTQDIRLPVGESQTGQQE